LVGFGLRPAAFLAFLAFVQFARLVAPTLCFGFVTLARFCRYLALRLFWFAHASSCVRFHQPPFRYRLPRSAGFIHTTRTVSRLPISYQHTYLATRVCRCSFAGVTLCVFCWIPFRLLRLPLTLRAPLPATLCLHAFAARLNVAAAWFATTLPFVAAWFLRLPRVLRFAFTLPCTAPAAFGTHRCTRCHYAFSHVERDRHVRVLQRPFLFYRTVAFPLYLPILPPPAPARCYATCPLYTCPVPFRTVSVMPLYRCTCAMDHAGAAVRGWPSPCIPTWFSTTPAYAFVTPPVPFTRTFLQRLHIGGHLYTSGYMPRHHGIATFLPPYRTFTALYTPFRHFFSCWSCNTRLHAGRIAGSGWIDCGFFRLPFPAGSPAIYTGHSSAHLNALPSSRRWTFSHRCHSTLYTGSHTAFGSLAVSRLLRSAYGAATHRGTRTTTYRYTVTAALTPDSCNTCRSGVYCFHSAVTLHGCTTSRSARLNVGCTLVDLL